MHKEVETTLKEILSYNLDQEINHKTIESSIGYKAHLMMKEEIKCYWNCKLIKQDGYQTGPQP